MDGTLDLGTVDALADSHLASRRRRVRSRGSAIGPGRLAATEGVGL